jgi:hypothetical protein
MPVNGGIGVSRYCTIEEDRLQRRLALSSRMNQNPCADKFRAIAEWWRIHAEESANPDEALGYAKSQDALASDMEAHPGRYAVLMPGETHWQKFCKFQAT